MNNLSQKIKIEKVLTWGTVLFIILIWYLVTALNVVSEVLMPSPESVIRSFIDICVSGYKDIPLIVHVGVSLGRLLAAFLIAVISAVVLGLLSGYSAKVRAIVEPIIEFYRPLPPLAYYTLLVLWMGIGDSSKIALLSLAAFAPIYISCVSAVLKIRADYVNSAYTMGASKKQAFFSVILPSCLPEIFVGIRTAIGVSYTTLVAAEMVAAASGIGWMVLDASRFLRSDVIFVGIIIMGITGILIDKMIKSIEQKIVPWKGKA